MDRCSIGWPHQDNTPASNGLPTALVVDDEPAFCDLMVRSLEFAGFSARGVCESDAVIPLLRQQPFDLVILDLVMPGVDGIAICRELRTFSAAAVLVVTAASSKIDTVDALLAGADGILLKPFRIDVAMAKIMAIMRRCTPDGHERTIKQVS